MINKAKNRPNAKSKLLILSLTALLVVGVIGSFAYIFTDTKPVENVFTPGKITTEIKEEFDGNVKKNVTVKNTGNIDIYVRVKLISYRVNNAGERIGGTATVPDFTLQSDWFLKDDYYYYSIPLEPGKTAPVLVDEIELLTYDDADGGKQVIEVHGEGIQSLPTTVITETWGVIVDADGHLMN